MAGRIEIGPPQIDGRRVTVPLVPTGRRARRLIREHFWTEYDFDPGSVPTQVLTIPAVASLLSAAWLEDLELTVSSLDSAFCDAVPEMRAAWGDTFSAFELGGSLEVTNASVTEAPVLEDRTLCLYSGGGLDSMASALLHADSDLILCTFWGIDVPWQSAPAWETTRSGTLRFAQRIGASATFARTNVRTFIDTRELNRRYGQTLESWEDGTAGITLLGMAAPAAVHFGASIVDIPATHTVEMTAPWGTSPSIDGTVRFAGVSAVHSGFHLDRVQKARLVADLAPCEPLLVCQAGTARDGRNCGACAKCYRTAANLIAAAVDPATVGLDVHWSGLARFARRFARGAVETTASRRYFWLEVKRYLPITEQGLNPAMVEFFRWLESTDLHDLPKGRPSPVRRIRGRIARVIPHWLFPAARRAYLRLFSRW